MRDNTTKPTETSNSEEEMEADEEIDSDDEEFKTLNTQIDQLNTVLDVLEKKNDDIKAQLVAILKSSREAREQEGNEEKPSVS